MSLQDIEELKANLTTYKEQLQQVKELLVVELGNVEYQEMAQGMPEVLELTYDLLNEAQQAKEDALEQEEREVAAASKQRPPLPPSAMQYDLEDLQNHCNHLYSQREIIALYERFCQLDRTGKGFISADEFMGVPEFAVNPLCQRLLKMLEGLNFKELIALLSTFSACATKDDKLKFIFRVYDTDGNGKVTSSDMLQVLRDLSGNFLTDEQRKSEGGRSEEGQRGDKGDEGSGDAAGRSSIQHIDRNVREGWAV